MKIRIISDIHSEFYDEDVSNLAPSNNDNIDLLIIAGDVMTAKKKSMNKSLPFWKKVNSEYDEIIYVLGNHEYYHGYIDTQINEINSFFKENHITNVHVSDVLENIQIGNYNIIYGTLWTMINPEYYNLIRYGMNDYHYILDSEGRRINPSYTQQIFQDNLDKIKTYFSIERINIIVTHHAPSFQSIDPDYVCDILNSAYATNLEEYIKKIPNLKLWVHGHIHTSNDYMIGNTRIISNPQGYTRTGEAYQNKDYNPDMIIYI